MAEPSGAEPRRRRRSRWPLLWRVPAAWRLLRDPAAKGWQKALIIASAAYVALPIDAVPDAAVLIGWLDDLGVVALAATVLHRALDEHSRR